MRWLVAFVCASSACVTSSSVICPDGLVCPDGTTCRTVAIAGAPTAICALPDQIQNCIGLADGDACGEGGSGTCHDGVCFEDDCGNGLIDHTEHCDGVGCSADCLSDLTCGNSITDPLVGEDCDPDTFATLSHDGCSSRCREEDLTWSSPELVPRPFVGAAYDPNRGIVLVGGGLNTLFDDTWVWDGDRWSAVPLKHRLDPAARVGVAYDAEHHKLVASTRFPSSGTWLLDEDGWRGGPPSPSNQIVYDPIRRRVLAYNEHSVFAWDGSTWQQLPVADLLRQNASLTFDPVRGRVVLYGGTDDQGDGRDHLWELGDTAWTQVAYPEGGSVGERIAFDPVQRRLMRDGVDEFDGTGWVPLSAPCPLAPGLDALVTDFGRGRVVAIAGAAVSEWDGTNWIGAPVAPLPLRRRHTADTDVLRREIVLFGGLIAGGTFTDETWTWRGAWTKRTSAVSPPPRDSATMAYDPARAEMILFGGRVGSGVNTDDTWIWNGSNWSQASPATVPARRVQAAMAWDGEQILMFGGVGTTQNFGDTWRWNGVTWTAISGPGPSPRYVAAIGYDPIRDHVVLFGGYDGEALGDTWLWSRHTQTWTPGPAVGPPARAFGKLAWDAARRALILVSNAQPDVWEWDGAWHRLDPIGRPQGFFMDALVRAVDGVGVYPLGESGTTALWELSWGGDGRNSCYASDVDGDGAVGCQDLDCWYLCTPYCPPGTTCDLSLERCGDGTCNPLSEQCITCPADCTCVPWCGDNACAPTESIAMCPGDCS